MKTEELLNFALQFSEATFDKSTAETLIPQYIQPDGTMPEDDYSLVTIHSRYAAFTWGSLSVQTEGERQITVTELTPTQMSVKFEYQILAGEEGEEQKRYNVEEYLCVRWRSGQLYLLDYERTCAGEPEIEKASVENGSLALGALGEDVQAETCEDGSITAISLGQEIYACRKEDGEIWPVFTFREETEDVRADYPQHTVSLVDCRDGGQIDFIVYGYMNRGSHEGEVGISFFRYQADSGRTDELLYIPTEVSYQVLKEDMGTLAYVSEADSFYILYGRSIYSIDISSGEVVELAENVMPGGYSIGGNGNLIAWQEGDSPSQVQKIRCLNMDSGELEELSAGEGEYLSLEGFIGSDIVYGIGRQEEVQTSAGVETGYPLYKLVIRDQEMQVQTEYEIEGMYITQAQTEGNRIVIERQTRDENGQWTEAPGDVLSRNAAVSEEQENLVKTEKNGLLGENCYVEIQADGAVHYSAAESEFRSQEFCHIVELNSHETEEQYYVYARGKLKTVLSNLSAAIRAAYDEMGTVLDENQNYLWNRDSRALYKTLKMPEKEPVTSENSLAACIEMMLEYEGQDFSQAAARLQQGESPFAVLSELEGCRIMDLYGSQVGYILYYINLGTPVLAVTGDSSAVLVIGYETNSLTYYDPVTAQNVKLSMDEAEEFFAGSGNAFLTYIK